MELTDTQDPKKILTNEKITRIPINSSSWPSDAIDHSNSSISITTTAPPPIIIHAPKLIPITAYQINEIRRLFNLESKDMALIIEFMDILNLAFADHDAVYAALPGGSAFSLINSPTKSTTPQCDSTSCTAIMDPNSQHTLTMDYDFTIPHPPPEKNSP